MDVDERYSSEAGVEGDPRHGVPRSMSRWRNLERWLFLQAHKTEEMKICYELVRVIWICIEVAK